MQETLTEVVQCSRCAFWQQVDGVNGHCRRHAPRACENMDEVAHWPLTRGTESCGEGVAARPAEFPIIQCGDCIYWRHAGAGIDPMLRLDQLSEWWRHAAHCVRFAPTPSREPGPRAYWRATNAVDGCFDGKPKQTR